MTRDGRRRGVDGQVELHVMLTPEHIQALLQLCDAIALRGPASKMLVAQAQGRLLRALEVGATAPLAKGEGAAG